MISVNKMDTDRAIKRTKRFIKMGIHMGRIKTLVEMILWSRPWWFFIPFHMGMMLITATLIFFIADGSSYIMRWDTCIWNKTMKW